MFSRRKNGGIQSIDIQYWAMKLYPFILMLYDGSTERAFWIEIDGELIQQLDLDQSTETIRIPIRNVLSAESIQLFRQKSLDVIEKLGSGDVDGQSKPR